MKKTGKSKAPAANAVNHPEVTKQQGTEPNAQTHQEVE
jgi:hypothetical protein